MSIRERDAAGQPLRAFDYHALRGSPTDWAMARIFVEETTEDRHALLTAGNALAEAAEQVAWPWPIVSATGSPMTRLLAAIAAWKETTG